jgi:hypothetical protein
LNCCQTLDDSPAIFDSGGRGSCCRFEESLANFQICPVGMSLHHQRSNTSGMRSRERSTTTSLVAPHCIRYNYRRSSSAYVRLDPAIGGRSPSAKTGDCAVCRDCACRDSSQGENVLGIGGCSNSLHKKTKFRKEDSETSKEMRAFPLLPFATTTSTPFATATLIPLDEIEVSPSRSSHPNQSM